MSDSLKEEPVGGPDEQLRLLTESLTDYALVFFDVDGRVSSWNAGAQHLFGYTESEALGLPLARFCTAEDQQRGVPARELGTAARQGRCSDDRWLVRKDGSHFWASGVTTALRDAEGRVRGFAKAIRDRTEVRAAEEALQASERRWRAIIEHSFDAVCLLDSAGVITYISPTIIKVLGYTPEERLGRNAFELMHPEDLNRVLQLFAQLLQTPHSSISDTFRYRHKDGSWRWVEATGTNLLGESGVQAIVANFHDVTETTRLLAELQQRAGELTEAAQRKDEFLAMLAHELRNPLAPIRNAAELLKMQGADEPTRHLAREVIDRQVRHLARLVDDLLDVSRVTRGKIQLRKEMVDAATIIARAVETARPVIEGRRHQLTIALPPQPLRLEADPTRLTQVLENLLSNAAKYMDEGGRIWLSARREDGHAVFHVRDTGMGIPREMLRKIFELFTQVDRALDRSQGGLGIGLALVHTLVGLHGGTVEAFSEGPKRGSEFVVRLPAVPNEPGQDSTSRRVLIVDDNVDAAESIAMVLESLGHEVRTAHDGPTALDAVEEFRPDIVLLDIGLPGMDGHEVARHLRRQHPPHQLVLVALTGYGQDEDRRRSQAAGFDFHLVKPIDPADLAEIITGATAGQNRSNGCQANG